MIKMIASDLDGTLLLNRAQFLPEEIFPLIRELKKLGILFVAASGRQYPNMKRMFQPVESDVAYICENGALSVENGQVLYQDSFDRKLAEEIISTIMAKENAEFTCSARDWHYLMPKSEAFRHYMVDVVKNDCKFIHTLDDMTEPIMKLAVYEPSGITDESVHYWNDRFGKKCKVVTSGNEWIDFIPFGTNKARGIQAFQKKYNILPQECMAFGDEYNDIEMLQAVKYSFAMAHSKERVKQAASGQTDRVEPVLRKLIKAKGKIEEVI